MIHLDLQPEIEAQLAAEAAYVILFAQLGEEYDYQAGCWDKGPAENDEPDAGETTLRPVKLKF